MVVRVLNIMKSNGNMEHNCKDDSDEVKEWTHTMLSC